MQTIVPKEPIVVGTAFQLQYIVHDAKDLDKLTPPDFAGFKLIAGPRIYIGYETIGGEKKEVQNIAYTLVAEKTGQQVIKGGTAFFKTTEVESNEAIVLIVNNISKKSPADVTGTTAFEEDIKQNIFIKLHTDKQTCFVGEPVMATFILYSGVPSTSEIIKHPGFYGFSLVEMFNLGERLSSVKEINGRLYETTVLRKLQLYPLQAGNLSIEEMEVISEVDIIHPFTNNVETKKFILTTTPSPIKVNSLPGEKKPKDYNGAVGKFLIDADITTPEFETNKQSKLKITVSGKGNFLQLNEPVINWPKGIEVFQPIVKEKVDQTVMPMSGEKIFEYSFTASDTGNYTIPAISFSYFDPSTKKYFTAATKEISFRVLPGAKKKPEQNEFQEKEDSVPFFLYLIGFAVVAVAISFLYFKRNNKKKAGNNLSPHVVVPEKTYKEKIATIELNDDITKSYSQLYKILYLFFQEKFGLNAAAVTSASIIDEMNKRQAPEDLIIKWKELSHEIEQVLYFNAIPTLDFETLKSNAMELADEKNYSAYL